MLAFNMFLNLKQIISICIILLYFGKTSAKSNFTPADQCLKELLVDLECLREDQINPKQILDIIKSGNLEDNLEIRRMIDCYFVKEGLISEKGKILNWEKYKQLLIRMGGFSDKVTKLMESCPEEVTANDVYTARTQLFKCVDKWANFAKDLPGNNTPANRCEAKTLLQLECIVENQISIEHFLAFYKKSVLLDFDKHDSVTRKYFDCEFLKLGYVFKNNTINWGKMKDYYKDDVEFTDEEIKAIDSCPEEVTGKSINEIRTQLYTCIKRRMNNKKNYD